MKSANDILFIYFLWIGTTEEKARQQDLQSSEGEIGTIE
jgi:hypothetical protein